MEMGIDTPCPVCGKADLSLPSPQHPVQQCPGNHHGELIFYYSRKLSRTFSRSYLISLIFEDPNLDKCLRIWKRLDYLGRLIHSGNWIFVRIPQLPAATLADRFALAVILKNWYRKKPSNTPPNWNNPLKETPPAAV